MVKIVDGDTITALDAQNTTIKIRMYGIDAPESKQAFGQKAKQALTTAIATKIVTVIDHGTDIYGRMLGTIWLDGYDINASMVDSGYAWVYRFEDNAIVPAISNMNPQHKRRQRVMGRHQPCPTMAVETGKRKAQKGEREEITMMKEPHPLLQLVLNDSGRLTMPVYYRDQQYCPTCLTKVLKSEDGSLAHLGK